MIKRNKTWKICSLPGYSLASRCTTDRLHVSLRTVTFCHGVLRSARFITAHYVSHFCSDCRGRFLNCQKFVTVSTVIPACYLPIPFPCVASRLSRFAHGCLKRGRRDRREHCVNAVLYYRFQKKRSQIIGLNFLFRFGLFSGIAPDFSGCFKMRTFTSSVM